MDNDGEHLAMISCMAMKSSYCNIMCDIFFVCETSVILVLFIYYDSVFCYLELAFAFSVFL